ncbi:hypothetical protein [Clostridium thermarum]|uniref:hypothetical protein n=1 Tax=Clostridium thermarum TaxID=1716543 RepID=UPI00111CEF35|nr:hypothetical protein [Clostridium thermarum]
MIKKHNFISEEYIKNIEKRESKLYFFLILLLVLLNIFVLQEAEKKRSDIETAKSKPVFSNIKVEDSKKSSKQVNIIELRRKVYGLAEDNVRISSFVYENNRLILGVIAQSPKQCISFVKDIEDKGAFIIEKLSPIEAVQENFKLNIELSVKGAE